jgi:predicted aldo/keto reductase-like oxidoreductase
MKQEKISRREFLAASSGAVLAGALGEARALEKEPLPTRQLGKTGEIIPILGIGSAFPITPPLLNAALAEGITYLDTAQSYMGGQSEKSIGAVLEKNGRRQECFIVTKCEDHDAGEFAQALPGSLENLGTEYVDLYYLHDLGDPDRLDREMMQTAERLKKEKKIRFFGFSSHHGNLVPTLRKAAAVGFVDAIMLKYNFRDYDNAELNQALDQCAQAGIGLIAMKTQGGAVSFQDGVDRFREKGFNQYQATLKAVWSDERIHGAVSAMKNIRQVQENAAAARNRAMGFEERELLRQYAEETNHLYCRGCGHLCQSQVKAPLQIADTLRYRMYYENYGERRQARELFAKLPEQARRIEGIDFSAAESACPHRLPIAALMREAVEKLA